MKSTTASSVAARLIRVSAAGALVLNLAGAGCANQGEKTLDARSGPPRAEMSEVPGAVKALILAIQHDSNMKDLGVPISVHLSNWRGKKLPDGTFTLLCDVMATNCYPCPTPPERRAGDPPPNAMFCGECLTEKATAGQIRSISFGAVDVGIAAEGDQPVMMTPMANGSVHPPATPPPPPPSSPKGR